MTAVDVTASGVELFARYAEAPNHLGYCGPPESPDGLTGATADDVVKAAKQFTGAWPYLQVMSNMTGIGNPLDHRLVESYWLGGGLGAQLDVSTFLAELLAVVAPQAGHYWSHLTDDLIEEAAPNHCFHVFGVYPWSRLLKHQPETPLNVLDNCRITWATVLSVDTATALVMARSLSLTDSTLSLAIPESRRVGLPASTLGASIEPGDLVAVHWGRICDRLIPEQVARLKDCTDEQLTVTNRRLGRDQT